MKKIVGVALAAVLTMAASPTPTGSFSLSPGPYREGGSITFTFGNVTHTTRNDENTLGVWCFLPDGSQIPWGNRGNPYIYEFNAFGKFTSPQTLYLPVEGTGYSCTAQYVVVDWFKGIPQRAWVLYTKTFEVQI